MSERLRGRSGEAEWMGSHAVPPLRRPVEGTTLIAGGGLAGAAAACRLGPGATLVEREAGPHDKVCGEFLSWDTQAYLGRLGVDPVALGAAPIDAVRLIHGERTMRAALPGRGLGLSRRILDEAVLAQAARNGATIIRGHSIRRLLPHGLDVETTGPLHADRVLLATGKHDLRDAKRAGRAGPLIGLKMFYRLSPGQAEDLANHVEVILFPGGYAGLQPVEAGRATLCLLVTRPLFKSLGATWPGVLAHLTRHAPHLARRLHGAEQQLDRPVAISGMPYGFVHEPRPADPPRLFRLGDQMGVIPSFSGDGMAIALHTAEAACTAADAAVYHRRMRRDLQGQIARAMALHRLGQWRPGLISAAVRAWPGALAWVARLTRVRTPDRSPDWGYAARSIGHNDAACSSMASRMSPSIRRA